MRLFIGNPTKQHHDFTFRLVESTSSRMMTIPMGTQVCIPGDLTQADIDYVLKQHEPYGMRRIDEVDRTKPYIGLVYSIDAPITGAKLAVVLNHNTDNLIEVGKLIRREAAIAVATNIEQAIADVTADVGYRLRDFESSFEEVEPRSGFDPNASHIGEGVRVDMSRQSPREPTKGRRRSAA